jgi:hypothetical protein
MPPLPLPLILTTIVLVFLPSIATLFLRFFLYQHLENLEKAVRRLINKQSSGRQPKILEELERRFHQASNQLDHVNTTALIDQVYSQEKIYGITCEQIDYWCRILPNLLLAFGLFGTFLGITGNLSQLSQAINQTNASNVNELVTELNKPLEGMSIAFVTSLTGLFFSTTLTVWNWVKNTSFAKYRLFSCLEDYLDNIYQPQIQGDTRLDKIVKRMVSQQDEFLTRFGSTVRDAVEQSMGRVAKQIEQGNREAAILAKQVYESFYQAAGTISTAATKFEHTIGELNAKAHIFKESADIFAKSQFPQKLSAATADLATTQSRFSQSAAILANTIESFATILDEVQSCTQELTKLTAGIHNINQSSLEIFNLHQANQASLQDIIPQLKQGANSYSKAINKLDKLDQKVVSQAENLNMVVISIKELLDSVQQHNDSSNENLSSLCQKLDNNTQGFTKLVGNVEGLSTNLKENLTLLINEIQVLHNSNSVLIMQHEKIGDHLIDSMNELTKFKSINNLPISTNNQSQSDDINF